MEPAAVPDLQSVDTWIITEYEYSVTDYEYSCCRCSVKAECRNSDEQSRWLPYSHASCPRILLVEPRHVQKLPTSVPGAAGTSVVSIRQGYGSWV